VIRARRGDPGPGEKEFMPPAIFGRCISPIGAIREGRGQCPQFGDLANEIEPCLYEVVFTEAA